MHILEPMAYRGEDAAMSVVPMVRVVVEMTEVEANAAAAHKRERDAMSSDILADNAKALARPVMVALVDAGYGL